MNATSAPSRDAAGRIHAPRLIGATMLLGYAAVRVALEARYRLFDPDEALEMLAAASLLDGKLPYLGALSHRGPFLTALYAAPELLFGTTSFRAVHAFCVLLFLAVGAGFQWSVARATNERAGLLALGSLLLLGTARVPTEDTWGLNSDFLMGSLAAAALSLLLGTRGQPTTDESTRRAAATYAGVGVLLALAFLTKQNGATFVVVPLAYIAVVDRDRLIAKLSALGAGFGWPVALAYSAYVVVGQVPRAWYFFFQYNRAYVGAAFGVGPTTVIPSIVRWLAQSYAELLVLGVLGAAVSLRRRNHRHAPWFFATVWTVAGLGAAVAPGKCWDNYLWASHAPLALLAGLGADALLSSLTRVHLSAGFKRSVAATVLVLPLLGCLLEMRSGMAVLVRATEVGGIPPPRVSRQVLLRLVTRVVAPDETIYVTGYAPEMYVLSARRPATDHVISNFVETVYPGRFEAPSVLSPQFFGELRRDLERTRPRLILDACALGFLCHPSSALTKALPLLLSGYEPLAGAPVGVYVRKR